MNLAEPLASYLTDFATPAVIGGVSVSGLFDDGYAESLNNMIAGHKPTFLCVAANLPALTLGTTTCVIDAVTYTVQETQPDGYGITNLILQAP